MPLSYTMLFIKDQKSSYTYDKASNKQGQLLRISLTFIRQCLQVPSTLCYSMPRGMMTCFWSSQVNVSESYKIIIFSHFKFSQCRQCHTEWRRQWFRLKPWSHLFVFGQAYISLQICVQLLKQNNVLGKLLDVFPSVADFPMLILAAASQPTFSPQCKCSANTINKYVFVYKMQTTDCHRPP